MRNLVLVTLFSFITTQAFAVQGLKPCSTELVKYIEMSVKDKAPEQRVYDMLNTANKLVGVFITDHQENIHVDICHRDNSEYTSATEWFYWDSTIKADPTKWKKNDLLEMSQDEGKASVKVLAADKKGLVKVEFSVIGWNEGPEVVLMKDTLNFIPRK
jgi:hypothetical protein